MAAVIRLKRRLDAEPHNTLILNCKKRKISGEDETSELSTILKFAGTVPNQEDTFTHLKKPTKQELENHFKTHNVDLINKLRTEKQLKSKESRYKIVNCFRSNQVAAEVEKECVVYDLESEVNEGPSTEKTGQFVYDLYYTSSDDLGDGSLEEYVSMCPFNDELVFGSYRDNGMSDSDESEDSNAENNWKNDYPDESDAESINEGDMIKAMKQCDLDSLSSDDGEEGLVYSIDSEQVGFEEDIDDCDIQRYGERYAKFKARHNKNVETTELKSDLYYGDIDEEEYYY